MTFPRNNIPPVVCSLPSTRHGLCACIVTHSRRRKGQRVAESLYESVSFASELVYVLCGETGGEALCVVILEMVSCRTSDVGTEA